MSFSGKELEERLRITKRETLVVARRDRVCGEGGGIIHRANGFTEAAAAAFAKKPTFLFLFLPLFGSECAEKSGVTRPRLRDSPAAFPKVSPGLEGIFEWKCGGGLADYGNRSRAYPPARHTYAKFYNTHIHSALRGPKK